MAWRAVTALCSISTILAAPSTSRCVSCGVGVAGCSWLRVFSGGVFVDKGFPLEGCGGVALDVLDGVRAPGAMAPGTAHDRSRGPYHRSPPDTREVSPHVLQAPSENVSAPRSHQGPTNSSRSNPYPLLLLLSVFLPHPPHIQTAVFLSTRAITQAHSSTATT